MVERGYQACLLLLGCCYAGSADLAQWMNLIGMSHGHVSPESDKCLGTGEGDLSLAVIHALSDCCELCAHEAHSGLQCIWCVSLSLTPAIPPHL